MSKSTEKIINRLKGFILSYNMNEEKYLRCEDACKLLKVVPSTLRSWDSKGKIKSIRTKGGHRRYALSSLLKLTTTTNKDIFGRDVTVHTVGKDVNNLEVDKLTTWAYHADGTSTGVTVDKRTGITQEAVALRKLALWFMDKEDNDKALELLMKSSEINRERQYLSGHRYNLACDYFDIGLLFTNKNDFMAAREFYTKSRQLFEKLKMKNELSDYYFNLGEISLFEKDYQRALEFYLKGLEIDKAQGNKPGVAGDYNMLGELYAAMDNFSESAKFFNQAVLASKEIDAQPELAAAYYNLGLLNKQKGRKNKAKENFRLAQEIYSRIDQSCYQKIKQEIFELDTPL